MWCWFLMQSDSVTYIWCVCVCVYICIIFKFFSIIVYYKTLNTVSSLCYAVELCCLYILYVCCAWLLSRVQLFATPWTVTRQVPLSVGILQAKILEWVAMLSSRGSSQCRDWTQVSHIAGGFFTVWITREAHFVYSSLYLLIPNCQFIPPSPLVTISLFCMSVSLIVFCK